MKTYIHLSLNSFQNEKYFRQMRNILDKIVEKIKTHFTLENFFPPEKSYSLSDNVKKYGVARQTTVDNIIRRMRCRCWRTNATDTLS
jgi:hemerythrin